MSGYRLMQAKKILSYKNTEPTTHWSGGFVIGSNPYVSISLYSIKPIYLQNL